MCACPLVNFSYTSLLGPEELHKSLAWCIYAEEYCYVLLAGDGRHWRMLKVNTGCLFLDRTLGLLVADVASKEVHALMNGLSLLQDFEAGFLGTCHKG